MNNNPQPQPEEQNALPHPGRRLRDAPPPAPQPEGQEALPHPKRRLRDDPDPEPKERDPVPDPKRRRDRDPEKKKKYKPPPGDREPREGRREKKPRFDYYEPEVEYEMCASCGYYACRCEYPYYEFHWGSYYLYEPDPYAHFEPSLSTTEARVFGFTTGTIVLNGLLAINDTRSGPAAFAGFAFGTASVVIGVSGKTRYPTPAVILGATAILFSYLNLQSPQPSDPFEDRLGSPNFSPSAPGMAVNLSF